MVVSKAKDSKRKRRKESPPAPQPSAVESSPEMPKRTKVQAQRKFAQGQSAPTSSYNSVIAASSSSNTGPSTSSESREPPTEILPNKRPKTEDFLTFLCFRGTRELPAHLDYLNQGKPKEPEAPVRKPIPKPTKATKKGKRGRPKTAIKDAEPQASTSATVHITPEKSKTEMVKTGDNVTNVDRDNGDMKESTDNSVLPFAVRKRAEVLTEGNRRNRAHDRQLRNTSEVETCNNSPESKRRSIRTSTKTQIQPETDDDEEYFSANDEDTKIEESLKPNAEEPKTSVPKAKAKTPIPPERNTETPSKESEKSRKSRASSSAKQTKDFPKDNSTDGIKTKESAKEIQKQELPVKEKQPLKRLRQKESPIFIPSPEPSGRMTRQRAFFEPVKVPHRDERDLKETVTKEMSPDSTNAKDYNKKETEIKDNKLEAKVLKDLKVINTSESVLKNVNADKTLENDKNKNMNVFDFSSDDEQPLAKSIKLKKVKNSPKKATGRINKQGKKPILKKTLEKNDEIKNKSTATEVADIANKAQLFGLDTKDEKPEEIVKSKIKRGKNAKKVAAEDPEEDSDILSASPKKVTLNTSRQSRKKAKVETQPVNGEDEKDVSPSAPIRSQRPLRKTKEAATIYMGIISHKLQLPDDEDDDNSLNSFPDLPNVKEMEKREIELKKSASQSASAKTAASSPSVTKSVAKQLASESPVNVVEKPTTVRRGRPPKLGKQHVPVKREIEGMLVKKGAITKIAPVAEATQNKDKSELNKIDSEDEDFLLNEQVNETKRKLEKSFSDSDDEPLAIKASIKTGEKDSEQLDSNKLDLVPQSLATTTTTTLTMLPLTTKPVSTAPLTAAHVTNTSPTTIPQQITPTTSNCQAPSPFKTIEKKSPVPTSKILNVPATYAIPSSNVAAQNVLNTTFNKSASYLSQAASHYHGVAHVRPPTAHQFTATIKSPSVPVPPPPVAAHLTAPPPPQSPLKYQTPPTTYPPPIEAYPSPKINPNFLTPKFDRTSLPRNNNFPSPSPVRFDVPSSTSKTGMVGNSTLSPKIQTVAMSVNVSAGAVATSLHAASNSITSAAATLAAATNSADPLKDEIGSILAANLMPSKEESGKIFGIASVSLAQSSGPDNTKCTLGKCGSIHKPVLGPVVPTEGYIGDQLSSKERRKAKVNMTHEQIQKWLIECSSNPDEIQDDLDDELDDNIRPNMFATTPPPTRDDKESTSFSSSSKATRDLGKSESAWSAKGPSLKATPVVATTNRKDEAKQLDAAIQAEAAADNEKANIQAVNFTQKSGVKQNSTTNEGKTFLKEKVEKKSDKEVKDEKSAAKDSAANKDTKQSKIDKEKEPQSASAKSTVAGKQLKSGTEQNQNTLESTATPKQNRKKNIVSAATSAATAADKSPTANSQKANAANSASNSASGKTPKRTPVYNQKTQKQIELKETTTTSHRKTAPFSYGAFSVENEKSIYSFDKDDDEVGTKAISKPAFRRQSRQDSHVEELIATPPTTRTSPAKKRAAAAAAEKANKDIANASQSSSVSLTLSPSGNCKQVKVSLEAEKAGAAKSAAAGKSTKATKKQEVVPTNDADSDSDGHTFYIPLQGGGVGGDSSGGIQGVAVKLGREGPDGPNQKVIMHATLVTKAQMGSNSRPLPDSMDVSDIVKTLMTTSAAATTAAVAESAKKPTNTSNVMPSTSAAAAVAAAAASAASASSAVNSPSNKNVPIGTVQPRFKPSDVVPPTPQPTTSTAAAGSALVRVNSNSSLFSGSAKSRIGVAGPPSHTLNKKFKDDTPIKMSNNTAFPRHDDPTQMVEAPIFRPTEKEFADPIEFIERITPIAARFGICKIIPPATFKPECRISDEMRFTAYNQYVHKMLHRWGPSAKEMSAIKKYLATQSIVMNHPPWIGGMEVDLPRLYHTVQELGGLKEVIEKKKWSRVAEDMCIPKLAQDRVTKLDDIYCKYLLPYDTLSPAERQKLFDEVEADWAKREARARRNADRFVNTESVSNEEEDVSSEDDEESEEEVDGVSMECIVKGRSMPLSQFYRIARNTMALWFKNTEPTVNEVEAEFWRHVAVRDSHVCVHSGSIDSSGWGYGFPSPGPKGKGSNYARHPWNLKVLTNNPGSVLRSLGPVMGVTVPTLHVGMLFSACCWYRDPHGLSWIEYLHTGASKLWYGIPDDQSANFRAALTSLIPTHCQNKTIWLPCDTVMVPPHMLTDRGVSLCRIEQKPGEFIVVFPRAYTSSLATGYVVSESVYFATTSWLDLAKDDFRDIHDSCEPAMFSLEQLLFALGYDQRVTSDTLQQMSPMLHEVFEKEMAAREQLKAAGVTSTEKVHVEKGPKAKKQQPPFKSIESECDLCRANLYISMVKTEEGNIYCLQHALKNLNNGNIQAKQCKLIYAYNVEDIENLIKNLKDKIQQKRSAIVHKKAK